MAPRKGCNRQDVCLGLSRKEQYPRHMVNYSGQTCTSKRVGGQIVLSVALTHLNPSQNAYLSMHFPLFLSLFPFSGLLCPRALFPPVSLLLLQMKSRDFRALGKPFTLCPHPLSFNLNTDSPNLMSYGKSLACKSVNFPIL